MGALRDTARRGYPAIRVAAAAVLCLALAGCVSWSTTRREVVEPVHDLLHHAWPEAFEEGDPGALAALFTSPEAAAPSLALLSEFSDVTDAIGTIETVVFEPAPPTGRVELRVDGSTLDGSPRTVFQSREVELLRGPDGWRIAADRPGPMRDVPRPSSFFYDEAQLRGLWFTHEERQVLTPEGERKRYIYGSGVAASDVDGDGWDDVLIARGDRVELFLNSGGRFQRASETWGLGDALPIDDPGIYSVVLPADFDGDGRRDLFLGAEFAQPRLLRNTGTRFEEVPDTGLVTLERTIGATAADFDGDGALDLYLANHEDVYREAPDLPFARNALRDQLFRGNGALGFREVTEEAGIDNPGWSLAPAPADFDGDGDVDLFVGNDFGDDTLLRNDGGRFVEVSEAVGVDKPVAAMSADWGDYDADGDLDLFVGGMASGSGWILEVPEFQIDRVPWIVDALFRPYVREAVRSWFRGNRLYENLGDGTFRERAAESGAQRNGWSWGSAWLDFDNDGHLDVYAANGFLSGPIQDDL